jgi:hypothetical protein
LGHFASGIVVCEDKAEWKAFLESPGFVHKRQVLVAVEGVLSGSILERGSSNPELLVVSDDAG